MTGVSQESNPVSSIIPAYFRFQAEKISPHKNVRNAIAVQIGGKDTEDGSELSPWTEGFASEMSFPVIQIHTGLRLPGSENGSLRELIGGQYFVNGFSRIGFVGQEALF